MIKNYAVIWSTSCVTGICMTSVLIYFYRKFFMTNDLSKVRILYRKIVLSPIMIQNSNLKTAMRYLKCGIKWNTMITLTAMLCGKYVT